MDQELDAYLAAIQADVRRLEEDVMAMQSSVDEVARVRELLKKLPEKVRHPAMVPYGKHAFFPGELIHINEFLVGLGANYCLEASAPQAAEVLGRRQGRAEGALQAARMQLEAARARASQLRTTLSNEEGDAFMEIRQDYEESEELLRSAKGRPPVPPPQQQSAALPASLPSELESRVRKQEASGVAAGDSAASAAAAVGTCSDADVGEKKLSPAAAGRRSGAPEHERGGVRHASANAVEDVEEEDERIFARLQELERLEAEAEAGEDVNGERESEEAGSSDAEAGEARQGRATTETRAAPISQRHVVQLAEGSSGPERGVAAADSRGAEDIQATAGTGGALKPAAARRRAAPAPLKRGFLLGGGKAGCRPAGSAATATASGAAATRGGSTSVSAAASAAAALAPAAGRLGPEPGRQRAESLVGSGSSGGAEASRPGGVQQTLELEGTTGRAGSSGRQRRVSFADGAVPGHDSEDRGGERAGLLQGPASGRGNAEGVSITGLRSALKEGAGVEGKERGSATGDVRGVDSPQPFESFMRPGRAAALEDDGDAAMAMARAREMAFTGLVCERSVDHASGRIESAVAEGAGVVLANALAGQGVDTGPMPQRRVSKFKQQRMGYV